MREKEKPKKGLRLGPILVVLIALVNTMGKRILFFLPLILIFIFFVYVIKRRTEGQKGEEDWSPQSTRTVGNTPQPAYRPRMQRPNTPALAALSREDDQRRIEELADLLKAGIIEKDEYNERLRDLLR